MLIIDEADLSVSLGSASGCGSLSKAKSGGSIHPSTRSLAATDYAATVRRAGNQPAVPVLGPIQGEGTRADASAAGRFKTIGYQQFLARKTRLQTSSVLHPPMPLSQSRLLAHEVRS